VVSSLKRGGNTIPGQNGLGLKNLRKLEGRSSLGKLDFQKSEERGVKEGEEFLVPQV